MSARAERTLMVPHQMREGEHNLWFFDGGPEALHSVAARKLVAAAGRASGNASDRNCRLLKCNRPLF